MTNSNAKPLTFRLPFPPSVNHYWRRVGNKTLLSKQGRKYQDDAVAEIWLAVGKPKTITGRLSVRIELTRKDRVKFDVDNYSKAVLDALEKARVIENDSQVDRLEIVRRPPEKPGCCDVTITETT